MPNIVSKPRRRGRPGGCDERVVHREEMLTEALKAFAEKGYDGMSMRELAAKLGISHGLIPARFGTKEQLWKAAFDQGMESLLAQVNTIHKGNTAEDKLRNAAVNLLVSLFKFPAFLQLANYEGARNTARLDYILESSAHQKLIAVFKEIIDEGVSTGELKSINPSLIFFLIAHGGGAALCSQPLTSKIDLLKSDELDSAKEVAEEIVEIVVRGVKV
ncbi:TetR/AcrR family transcriptional regulator [Pseudomaricurvus alcaniphilus]|uniref:TetR/AcrR family transcriptional regulator n=1 Tax=Pseudomaricurvus alcaniphilus TaxID=1166482 RepID=UPI001407C1EF|nr:TetR/AcrR family transcriptional regulator [Pseudomaricurvus alcaniphilus]NHN36517.1 TetR/AcrR family transcriptional regulator [Pseudomaricurvus alcaniphilus]